MAARARPADEAPAARATSSRREATVAARVVPAESVGGDFYHLFRAGRRSHRRDDRRRVGPRLPRGAHHGAGDERVGHPRAGHSDPGGDARARCSRSLRDELDDAPRCSSRRSTASIDRRAGELRYANAGHPHAFVVRRRRQRGAAARARPAARHGRRRAAHATARPWQPRQRPAVLFTDGISDARDRAGARLGEERGARRVVARPRAASPTRSSSACSTSLRRAHRRRRARDDLTLVVAAERERGRATGGDARLPARAQALRPALPRATSASWRASPTRCSSTGAETVVEIGPGRGALTDLLAERARPPRRDRARPRPRRASCATRYADRAARRDRRGRRARRSTSAALAGGDDFVLAGNVPYYITTPILFHALQPPRPRRAVYLVQREVAERIGRAAGRQGVRRALGERAGASPTSSSLFRVPPGAFQPPPKVDSAVIRVTPRADAASSTPSEEARFRALVQAAFGLRRKQLRRVAAHDRGLDAEEADAVLRRAGIDPEARPETLAPARLRAARAGARERRDRARGRPRTAERADAQSRFVSAKREPFELHRHVHRLERDAGRDVDLGGREVQDRPDAGADDAVDHVLRVVGRDGEHGDVGQVARGVAPRAAAMSRTVWPSQACRSCPGCCRRRRSP